MFRSNVPPQGLPEGWRAAQLRDVGVVHGGGRLGLNKSDYVDAGVVAYSAAGPDGFVSVQEGVSASIILSAIGARCGKSFLTDGPWATLANTQVITPDPRQADAGYLIGLLDDEGYWNRSGSAQPFIKPSDVKGAWVPLPPLDEQRRIAEVLRSVDEAIAANNATLAATRQIVEKLARDVADGGSDTATIGQFGRIVTGGTPSPKQADLWGGDLPFVTPGDLNEDEVSVREAARTLNDDAPHGARVLPSGSVLVTCIGSTVGKTAIARSSCATNQQINAICCDPAISGYVYLACVAAYDEIMANAGKQAVPIINKSAFSAITVATRSRADMVAISEMVDALDNEGKAARSALAALNGIKSNLMTDLLSGCVRVPA